LRLERRGQDTGGTEEEAPGKRAWNQNLLKGEHYESSFIGAENLREVQDCAAAGCGARNLRESEAQATARIALETGGSPWHEFLGSICHRKNGRKSA
jgi:hypothetical protein